ncbi:MAG TPA: NTP transferase domain-containing protein [Oligoflexia bacterium]|nr:NTP transferase domain-containing protein [Oligoflexia bacterium]
MQCVILAGGLGTRMRGVTRDEIPKALIPVASSLGTEPFAFYQLKWLASCGVTNVVYSIGFLGEQIRAVVGNGSRWGLTIKYVDEGKELRGTGGALRKAFDEKVLDERFFVVYGDSFLPIELLPIWSAFAPMAAPALMTVLKNRNQWDSSNVIFENNNLRLYKKNATPEEKSLMHYIDYGLSLIRRKTIATNIEADRKTDLAAVYEKLSVEGRLLGYEVQERFYEIGSEQGLRDFEHWLKKQENIQWLSRLN